MSRIDRRFQYNRLPRIIDHTSQSRHVIGGVAHLRTRGRAAARTNIAYSAVAHFSRVSTCNPLAWYSIRRLRRSAPRFDLVALFQTEQAVGNQLHRRHDSNQRLPAAESHNIITRHSAAH